MRLVIKEAKTKGIPAKMAGSKLMVNNVTYDFHNLSCLPKDLQVSTIKTKECDGDIVFQSEHSWLSNFFPSPVTLQGIEFHSAEQAFQYAKACRNKQPEIASMVLKSKTARAAKKHGAGVERNREWDQQKEEIMIKIVNAKFRQNSDLGRKLILTGSKRLVEATMDRYWGAFATPNAKSIIDKTWKGANRLGLILMDIRSDLRREHPEIVQLLGPDPSTSAMEGTAGPSAGEQLPIVDRSDQPTELAQSSQATQPAHAFQNVKPTPPARTRKSARKRDEVSPLTFPPVNKQKTDVHSATTSTVGSPTSKALVPPVGDLFAPPEISLHNKSNTGHIEDLFAASESTISASQPEGDHTVIIGSQEI